MAHAREEVALGPARRIGRLLGLAQRPRGLVALGDVVGHALEARDGAIGVTHHAHGFGDPADGAIASPNLGFKAGDLVAGPRGGEQLLAPVGAHVDLAGDVRRRGDELGGRVVAEQTGERGVGADEAPVGQRDVEALEGVLEDAAVFQLRLGEGEFRPAALDRHGGLLGHEVEQMHVLLVVGVGLLVVLHRDHAEHAAAGDQGCAQPLRGGPLQRRVAAAGAQQRVEFGRGGQQRAAGFDQQLGKPVRRRAAGGGGHVLVDEIGERQLAAVRAEQRDVEIPRRHQSRDDAVRLRIERFEIAAGQDGAR